LHDGELLRFRCRVGHTFSADSLMDGQSEALERALWSAIRGMEERAALSRRIGQRMRARGTVTSAKRFDEQAQQMEEQAALLRQFVLKNYVSDQPIDDSLHN
jgi:two-component system chemotaxis response regulator CheB